MIVRILSACILLNCLHMTYCKAQNDALEYKVINTWDYATEEIEEFPFIVGDSLIRKLNISSLIIKVTTIPFGTNSTKEFVAQNTSFGGLIAFNKKGFPSFSSAHKVIDWEKHRPKLNIKNIITPKKDLSFPIRHGSIYYEYKSERYRNVFFFFENRSDSLPEVYLNCAVHHRTVLYKPPHHLKPQSVFPKVPKEKFTKEGDYDISYHYEETTEGFIEIIRSNDSESTYQKNLYNKKKQLMSTYERTSPFRIYIEEHFYTYNEQHQVERDIRIYHDRGMLTRDTTAFKYNDQGQLSESLNTTEYGYPPEEFTKQDRIQSFYYYDSKGLLKNKVIVNLDAKVRFVCAYVYNPSVEEIQKKGKAKENKVFD